MNELTAILQQLKTIPFHVETDDNAWGDIASFCLKREHDVFEFWERRMRYEHLDIFTKIQVKDYLRLKYPIHYSTLKDFPLLWPASSRLMQTLKEEHFIIDIKIFRDAVNVRSRATTEARIRRVEKLRNKRD